MMVKCVVSEKAKGLTVGKEYEVVKIGANGFYHVTNDNGQVKSYDKGRFELGENAIDEKPKFPEFIRDMPQVLDPEKLSNQLDKSTEYIRKEISTVAKSFCKIGFKLWEIRENKLYIGQDFKNVYEYAETTLGLKKASCAMYIAVCERFSIEKDGKPTAQLKPDYIGFSYTQLALMSSMPDEKLEEITPETTCKEIREKKKAETETETETETASVNDTVLIPVFNRALSDENIDLAIKVLRENLGRNVRIFIQE